MAVRFLEKHSPIDIPELPINQLSPVEFLKEWLPGFVNGLPDYRDIFNIMNKERERKIRELQEVLNDSVTLVEIALHIDRYDKVLLTTTYIRRLCITGRIGGAHKIGKIWVVAKDNAIDFILHYNSVIKKVGKPRSRFIKCPSCDYEF